jgi:hypothetical protein
VLSSAHIILSAHKQWDGLSDIGDLIKPQSTNRKDFIQECKSGKLNGVVAAYRTFGSISITGLIDEELVNSLPKSWRYLAHNGESAISLVDLDEEDITEFLAVFSLMKIRYRECMGLIVVLSLRFNPVRKFQGSSLHIYRSWL